MSEFGAQLVRLDAKLKGCVKAAEGLRRELNTLTQFDGVEELSRLDELTIADVLGSLMLCRKRAIELLDDRKRLLAAGARSI